MVVLNIQVLSYVSWAFKPIFTVCVFEPLSTGPLSCQYHRISIWTRIVGKDFHLCVTSTYFWYQGGMCGKRGKRTGGGLMVPGFGADGIYMPSLAVSVSGFVAGAELEAGM